MQLAQRHQVFIEAVFRSVIQMRDRQIHQTAATVQVSLPAVRPVWVSPLFGITLKAEDQLAVRRTASRPLALTTDSSEANAVADLAPVLRVSRFSRGTNGHMILSSQRHAQQGVAPEPLGAVWYDPPVPFSGPVNASVRPLAVLLGKERR